MAASVGSGIPGSRGRRRLLAAALLLGACRGGSAPAPIVGIETAPDASQAAAAPAAAQSPLVLAVQWFNPAFGFRRLEVRDDGRATCEVSGKTASGAIAPGRLAEVLRTADDARLCDLPSLRREGLVNTVAVEVGRDGRSCRVERPEDAWKADAAGARLLEILRAVVRPGGDCPCPHF